MVNVIHRTTLKYKSSVNGPDYDTNDWIHSPDLSLLTNVTNKYWKVSGDTVIEMSQAEKDVVDTAKVQTTLDVSATNSEIQKMTTAERDDITTPSDGCLIYNTTTNKLNLCADGAWTVIQ